MAALVDTRHEYSHLFSIYVPIAVGVFAFIFALVILAVALYWRRPLQRAARWHEHNPLEGGYAALLACVVAFLLYLTFAAEHRVDTVANRAMPAVTIDVSAAKWEWTFSYRGTPISLRSGVAGRGLLLVPTGEPIRLNLRSQDVIHALWIGELRYKHDLIPGSTQVTTVVFPRSGTFSGECAEFCGLRHSDMVFKVRALPPAQFAAWIRSGGRARP